MKTVYKYPIQIKDEQWIAIPGGEILTVGVQRGEPFIWAKVKPSIQSDNRKFRLVGTGHPIDEKETLVYIGTFQLSEYGDLVFHLFEVDLKPF